MGEIEEADRWWGRWRGERELRVSAIDVERGYDDSIGMDATWKRRGSKGEASGLNGEGKRKGCVEDANALRLCLLRLDWFISEDKIRTGRLKRL